MASGNVFDDATSRDLIAIVRQWRSGKLASLGSSLSQPHSFQELLPFVSNDSGEAIPPYACMQVTGTVELGSKNYLVVDKPADTDGSAGAFLFNGPREIADGEEGLAQLGPVLRAIKDTGTVTGGDRWIPVIDEWYIEQDDGGQFICCGDDDVDTNVLKVKGYPSSSSGSMMRIGFRGRDASDAFKWNPGTGASTGYVNFSTWSSSDGANINASGMGVSVVSHIGGGVPASAERLRFASGGIYKINLAWQVGTNGSGVSLISESRVSIIGSGTDGGQIRKLASSGTSSVVGYNVWLQDTRLIELIGTNNDVVISINTNNGLSDPPAIGMAIIEKL